MAGKFRTHTIKQWKTAAINAGCFDLSKPDIMAAIIIAAGAEYANRPDGPVTVFDEVESK